MNKLLIKVLVPKLETSYEIFVPINKKMHRIRKQIIQAINELNDNALGIDDDILLYDKLTGEAFNLNAMVKDSGLKNGSELILV